MVGAVFSAGAHAAPGDLDLTFSGDGKQTTDFGAGSSSAKATVGQPDGKIVAVGGSSGGRRHRLRAHPLQPERVARPELLRRRRQTTDFGGFDAASGVALRPNGKIVVVGRGPGAAAGFRARPLQPERVARHELFRRRQADDRLRGPSTQASGWRSKQTARSSRSAGRRGGLRLRLARYNPNGSLDPSFSGDGRQTTDFGGSDEAKGVALRATARSSRSATRGAGDHFALARYNPNGSLDPSFSGDGKQTTDFGGFDVAYGVTLQGDGKIVAVGGGGTAAGGFGGDFALARYNPNGSLDPSFSGDGKQTTDFGGFDRASGVELQADGKIVAVGNGGAGDDFALARYNPNGSLDPSFSADGRQTTDFGGGDAAHGVALQGERQDRRDRLRWLYPFRACPLRRWPGLGGLGHEPRDGLPARVQAPYLDGTAQVTAYTEVFCPRPRD